MERYESYKDSGVKWIGEIPSHWEVRKAKYIWKEKEDVSTNGRETLLSVSQYNGVVPNTEASRSESLIGYKIVENNNLVINIMLAWMGGLGVSRHFGIVSPAYCVYKTITKCDTHFLHYLYKTPLYLSEFARRSSGIVPSRWRMYTDDFGQVQTLLPPISEQTAIANYLDSVTSKIDEAISQQQQMIDLLNERKQIIIQNAVTKGLDPNVKMKDSGVEWIGEIPEDWEVKRLKFLVSLFGRIGFRGYSTTDLVQEGEGAITLSPSNMKNHEMDYSKCSYLSWEKYYESPEIMISNGDILFVKTGSTYGKTALVNGLTKEATINPQILVIKNIKCNNIFLSFSLQTNYIKSQVELSVIGGTIPTISQQKIGDYYIVLPNIEIQNSIVKRINEMVKPLDSSISQCNKMISLLQERKQIIINDVVTGKVKVC